MKYQAYKKRIQKVSTIFEWTRRHRIAILAVAGVLFVLLASFLATFGVVYAVEFPDKITYGDNINFEAKALFSNQTNLEFSPLDTDEWTNQQPTLAGQYKLRALSQRSFDTAYYTQPQAFAILPKQIEVKVSQKSLEYGAMPTVSADLVAGDKIECDQFKFDDLSAQTTTVCALHKSLKITNARGEDVTSSYSIQVAPTNVSFVKRQLTVKTADATANFVDGNALFAHDFELTAGSLAYGDRLAASFDNSLVHKGQLANTARFTVLNTKGIDVSANYQIEVIAGTLTMFPLPIEVTTKSQNFVYNGQPQVCSEFSTSLEFLAGHFATVKQEGQTSLKNVEKIGDSFKQYKNIFTLEIFDNNGDNVSKLYELTYNYGDLTMRPQPITVTTKSQNFVYNGELQFCDEFSTSPMLVAGHTALADGVQVGLQNVELVNGIFKAYQNKLSVQIFEGADNASHNYDITYVFGNLTMRPLPIVVTTANRDFVYSGQFQFCGEFSTSPNLVAGHYATVAQWEQTWLRDVEQTVNGFKQHKNVFQIEIFDADGNSLSHNYNIAYTYGNLRVLPRKVNVETASNTWTYDGFSHTDQGFTVQPQSQLEGILSVHTAYVASVLTKVANVVRLQDKTAGSVENKFEVKIFDGYADVTHNYEIIYTFGRLTIEPREITVKLSDTSKEYDATPLTSTQHKITSAVDIVEEQIVHLTANGTQTQIGKSNNSIVTIKITDYGRDATYNYNIKTEDGWLTVTKRTLTIFAESSAKVYDGDALENSDFKVGGLLNGHQLSGIRIEGSQTEVGWGTNTVVVDNLTITANGVDVSEYYDVNFRTGNLQVGLAEIAVSTGSAEKPFDGTPLVCDEHEIEGQILDGHSITVDVYGSQTEVGVSDNWADIYVFDSVGLNITYLYIVNRQFGRLTVTGIGDSGDGGGGDGGSGFNELGGGNINRSPSGGDDEALDLFRAKSETSETAYLRYQSFGDYNTQTGWEDAAHYLTDDINPLSLMYQCLSSMGKLHSNVTIEPYFENLPHLLPYYAATYRTLDDTNINMPYSPSYSYNYIPYTYKANDKLAVSSEYQAFERAYYQYVLQTYLQLPNSTLNRLRDLATDFQLDPSSPTIINDVATLVQNKVRYDKKFNEYVGDIAVFFFTQAQTGICQHYATAATAMFRALGIPARYTTGFAAEMSKNQWVEVSEDQYHAWVEVYIQGAGWVYVEVTGGGPGGSGGGSGEQEKEQTISDILAQGLAIKPLDVHKKFDGTPLYAPNQIEGYDLETKFALQQLLDLGYTYYVEVEGSRTDSGISYSKIVYFVLYDPLGNDITDKVEIAYLTGIVRILNEHVVTINLHTLEKTYDGTPLSYKGDDYWAEGLPDGFQLKFTLTGSLTNSAMLTAAHYLELPFVVYDDFGQDVTDVFSLVFEGKPLTVYKRPIEISSASETKVYDGTPLTNGYCWVSKGFLPPTHHLEAVVEASIVDIGTTPNTVKTVTIFDQNGNNVTSNYIVSILNGELKIQDD